MSRQKNVQDAVWGNIGLERDEWTLVNLPLFQRLRRIHQLAMTSLTFPGTTHTRFEHSLGVCHVAGLIGSRLRSDDEAEVPFTDDDYRLARLTGLLHDLGHGPFSHVSDKFLGKKGHETIGAMMIRNEPGIALTMSEELRNQAASILEGRKPRTVVADIVSGPTDADKVDYLLRDSHYAGVQQGRFDHHHFIDQAIAIRSRPDTMLGFRWKGLWAVEGLLLARYHMHRTVYGHPKRILTDLMLQRGMALARDERLLPRCLFVAPTLKRYDDIVAAYHLWDDWSVLGLGADMSGAKEKKSRARRVFRHIREHDLPKLVVHLETRELHDLLGDEAARALESVAPELLEQLSATVERRLASELGVDGDLIYVRIEDPNSPLDRPSGPQLDEDVLVVTPTNVKSTLRERSEVFQAVAPPRVGKRKLLVFAPPDHDQAKVAGVAIGTLKEQVIGGTNDA